MDSIFAFLFFTKFIVLLGTLYSIASIVRTIVQHTTLTHSELYCQNVFVQHQWRAFYNRSQNKYSYTYAVLFILVSIISNDNIISLFTNRIIPMPNIVNLMFNLATLYNIVIGIWYLQFQITLHSYINKNIQRDIPNQIARIIVSKNIKLPSRNYLLYLDIENIYPLIIKSKNTLTECLIEAYNISQESFDKASFDMFIKNKKTTAPMNNIGYYVAYLTLMSEYLIYDIKGWKKESENLMEITIGLESYINLSEILPICLKNTKCLNKRKYKNYIDKIFSTKIDMEYFLKHKKHRIIPCIWDD